MQGQGTYTLLVVPYACVPLAPCAGLCSVLSVATWWHACPVGVVGQAEEPWLGVMWGDSLAVSDRAPACLMHVCLSFAGGMGRLGIAEWSDGQH
jgi:hypothetical protein